VVNAISPPLVFFADCFSGVLDQIEKDLNELVAFASTAAMMDRNPRRI